MSLVPHHLFLTPIHALTSIQLNPASLGPLLLQVYGASAFSTHIPIGPAHLTKELIAAARFRKEQIEREMCPS